MIQATTHRHATLSSSSSSSSSSSWSLFRATPPARGQTQFRRGGAAPSQASAIRRPSAVTFRRRRVAAGVLGLGLVFASAQTAGALGSSNTPTATRGVAVIHYRVHAGDTLWSIASVLAPNDDPRDIVDLLAQAHGGSSIRPGDVIDWAGR